MAPGSSAKPEWVPKRPGAEADLVAQVKASVQSFPSNCNGRKAGSRPRPQVDLKCKRLSSDVCQLVTQVVTASAPKLICFQRHRLHRRSSDIFAQAWPSLPATAPVLSMENVAVGPFLAVIKACSCLWPSAAEQHSQKKNLKRNLSC